MKRNEWKGRTQSHFQIELTIEIRQMSKTTFHYYDFIRKTDSYTHANSANKTNLADAS